MEYLVFQDNFDLIWDRLKIRAAFSPKRVSVNLLNNVYKYHGFEIKQESIVQPLQNYFSCKISAGSK